MSNSNKSINALHTCAESLDRAPTIEVAFEALSRCVTELGFAAIAYTLFPRNLGPLGDFVPIFLSSPEFSQGFLAHYQEADLMRHDFTIPRVKSGYMGAMEWQLELEKNQLSADQRNVVLIAKHDYHIRDAVTLPCHCDEHIVAGATVLSYDSPSSFQRLKDAESPSLKIAIALFNSYVLRHIHARKPFYEPFLSSLSRNESCLIEHLVQGRTMRKTKQLYGISSTNAGSTLSKFYDKINVKNGSECAHLIGRHMIPEMLKLP